MLKICQPSRILHAVFCIPVFLVIALTGFAQTANFGYFGVENGLPQSAIQSMVQDKKGYLWIGTMSGVSRYNGQKFKTYSSDNGLAENWITSSCLDHQGNVWFGHWAGGISRYDAAKDTIQEIILNGIALYKPIYTIYEDRAGRIWCGTEGTGAILLKPVKGQPKAEIAAIINRENGLSGNNIYSIIEDKKGMVWFATDSGITKYNPQQPERSRAFEYFSSSNFLPCNNTSSLMEDAIGRIWIGTKGCGIVRFTPPASGRPSRENFSIYTTKDGLAHNHVKVVYQGKDKSIWAGTFGGGISKYIPEEDFPGNERTKKFRTIGTSQGLSNNKVLSILHDRENNLWVGTFIGLNLYRIEHFQIYGKQNGLTNTLIWSVIQDKNKKFWFGTDGGLIKYNPSLDTSDNKLKAFTSYTRAQGLANNSIIAVHEDAEGYIWASTWGEGVSRLNPANGKIQRFTKAQGLPSNDVYCIASDKDGNVWLGTDREGAIAYNPKTAAFTTYNIENGLGSNRIFTIFQDSKKNLWFGALGGDLTKYDGSKFRTFTKTDGLMHNFTLCITEDKQGNIWIGTYGGGLYKFNGSKFTNISSRETLDRNTPYLLACDNENNIWMGTSLGLDKYDPKENMFTHYGKQEGFLGIETNPNAVCKDDEGNLWFGTILGAVKYNSKKDNINKVEPLTYIFPPLVFNKKTIIPGDHVFNHNQNQLTFEFLAISLANPPKVMYQYLLEGYDNDWSSPKRDNIAHYTNLPPGKYKLLVKACNNDRVWNKKPVEYAFEIVPPWYRKPWAIAAFLLAASGLIYLFVKWRISNLKEAQHLLEEQVAIKTKELREEKEKVEKTNAELEKLSIVASETDNAVIIANAAGEIEWVNAGYVRMSGYSLAELKMQRGANLREASINNKIEDIIAESVRTGKSVIYESVSPRKDGTEYWSSSTLTPIFDGAGNLKKIIIIETDITERKNAEHIIHEKNVQLEQKNKDITDSINYAKRIQEAILPHRELIQQSLPESLILYKPKDIVSGDFYWFGERKDKIILAAVDCTGHGVPGAFMSIIGYTLLNEIIYEKNITDPGEILNVLDKEVIQALHQGSTETRDGMDVSICTFDFKKQELHFAGALRPLYILNKNEFTEVKGDKFPIGGKQIEVEKEFSTKKIKLRIGDTVYLFSDGYTDQFGGPSGKKFMVKNFKNHLMSIQDMKMKEQELYLKKIIEDWQGSLEQVDDIMVMGIRV